MTATERAQEAYRKWEGAPVIDLISNIAAAIAAAERDAVERCARIADEMHAGIVATAIRAGACPIGVVQVRGSEWTARADKPSPHPSDHQTPPNRDKQDREQP